MSPLQPCLLIAVGLISVIVVAVAVVVPISQELVTSRSRTTGDTVRTAACDIFLAAIVCSILGLKQIAGRFIPLFVCVCRSHMYVYIYKTYAVYKYVRSH